MQVTYDSTKGAWSIIFQVLCLLWFKICIAFSYFLEDDSQSEDEEQPSKVQSDDDEPPAKVESDHDEPPVKVESDDDEPPAKIPYEVDEQSAKVQLEEDEQLAKAIQESLNVDSPPRYDSGSILQPYPFFNPGGNRYMWSLCDLLNLDQ